MDKTYIPPARRAGADGASRDALMPDSAPNNQSRQNNRYHNRGAYRGRGYRGNTRQGRGGSQNDVFTKRSDLYHQNDIHNYFWGSESDAGDSHSSTFHGSKDRPDDLSYLLLFCGANPRWANDHIVFAKSNLALLPEYASKKAENGEWVIVEKASTSSEATTDYEIIDAPNDQDVIAPPSGQGVEAQMQPGGPTSAGGRALSRPSVNEPGDGKDGKDGKDATAPIHAADPAAGQNQPDVGEEKDMQHRENLSDQALTIKKPESKPSTNIFDGKSEQSASDKNAEYEKQKDQSDDAGPEGIADDAGHSTSILTSSFASASRLKYTDIRKEEAQATSQSTLPEGQAEYTDGHAGPASGPSNNYEAIPPQPVFPAIPPIDYAPTSPAPIAVFEEHKTPGIRTGGNYARFEFKGWFKISRINILAPHSAELVRMLQQKWERKDRFGNTKPSRGRNSAAWNVSLTREWAVVGFALLGKDDDAPPTPQIERLPRPEQSVVVGREEGE